MFKSGTRKEEMRVAWSAGTRYFSWSTSRNGQKRRLWMCLSSPLRLKKFFAYLPVDETRFGNSPRSSMHCAR